MAEKPNAYRNLLGINKASFTLAVIAFILSVVDLGFRLEYRTDQFFLFIYICHCFMPHLTACQNLYQTKQLKT